LYVSGYGRTYNFSISNAVFDDVYKKTARLYYYQRAGTDLLSGNAGTWSRKAGHVVSDANAVLHSSQLSSSLYNGEVIGSMINLSRGWYDAGDYGNYVTTAVPTLYELFTAYELFPEKFG